MTTAIRSAVKALDSTLPVFRVWTMEEGLRRIMAQARFNTLLMSLLGATGLVLAALGIYSVIAWLVAQRTREIGVRMALGASKGDVIRMMSLHGLKPVIAGLAIGFAGAIAATRLLQNQLFEIGPRDPMTLARDRRGAADRGRGRGRDPGVARDRDRSVDGATGVARDAPPRPTARSSVRQDSAAATRGFCPSANRRRRRCVANATSRLARSPGSRNVTPSCPGVITSPSTGA